MQIAGPDGQSIELRIIGYQFPECATEDYDSNWLSIEGRVTHPRGSWKFRDACLLTYEALALAEWLESGACDQSPDEASFIEPNLVFRRVRTPEGPRLRVYFELESRPAWDSSRYAGREDLWVEFPIVASSMRSAAVALREQLARYPQRGRR